MEYTATTEDGAEKGRRDSQEEVPVSVISERATWNKLDQGQVCGLVGIIATILNVFVMVCIYIYTHV